MRIFNGETEIKIPKWFTISQSTISVKAKTNRANDVFGTKLIGDDDLTERTFKCEGIIFTEKYSDVEKVRSTLQDSFTSKILKVFRDDDDEIYYKCFLDGDIITSYYNGVNLAKLAKISFTLKTFEPFGFGKDMTMLVGSSEIKTITLAGNKKLYPNFFIYGEKSFNGVLLECNGRTLELKKSVSLIENESLFFDKQSLYKTNNQTRIRENVSTHLKDESIISPIFLNVGENKIKCNQGFCIIFYNDMYI